MRHLLAQSLLERERPATIEVESLAAYERPLPELGAYDRLLVVAR